MAKQETSPTPPAAKPEPQKPSLWSQAKLFAKRTRAFLRHGGLSRINGHDLARTVRGCLESVRPRSERPTIFWLGAFPPYHANLGDLAQTVAVERFLHEEFPDYRLESYDRLDLTERLVEDLVRRLRDDDLVFLQSSGDFGSFHDGRTPMPQVLPYTEFRRRIAQALPGRRIINLPTTVYYGDSEPALKSLERDRQAFGDTRFTLLCREEESLRIARDRLPCEALFFPDFVFRMRPRLSGAKRTGARLLLRNDSEAALDPEQRAQLKTTLSARFGSVIEKDILHSPFATVSIVRDECIEEVLDMYCRTEVVVTDKMHGMIIATITGTPCIAVSSRIPHKIRGYTSLLEGAVHFADTPEEILAALEVIQSAEYRPVDLRAHFDGFRKDILRLADAAGAHP